MKNSGLYSFGGDGGLWTLINGCYRRPSTADEREGYCLERRKPAERPVYSPPPSVEETLLPAPV
ncbi:MAG: hypothetical protein IH994_04430 [Proteobacteria bacterium]|nr:hypothetical protein [Pseudomonadota bacterium]